MIPFFYGVEAKALDPDDFASRYSLDQSMRGPPCEIHCRNAAKVKWVNQIQRSVSFHSLSHCERRDAFCHADFNDGRTPCRISLERCMFFRCMLRKNRPQSKPRIDRMRPRRRETLAIAGRACVVRQIKDRVFQFKSSY